METLQCDQCKGTINEETRECILPLNIYTNLSAPNIINMTNTKEEEQEIIDQGLAENN